MRPLRRSAMVAITLLLAAVTTASAQVGGAPTSPTLLSFLGIPQGIRKMQGAMRNRRGNRPNREPKPPLKAIADPANLDSPDRAIKKAAEIKQAEDLKKQKIKAVKYLAGIGCGCYDLDGGVTKALVASMGDCTEDVRLETVKAIADAAEDGCCSKCGSVCCCNKDILMKLAEMAYERDDHGCCVEPSARVRQEAAEAIIICCPNDLPPVIVDESEPIPPPIKPRETSDEEGTGTRETGGDSSPEEDNSADESEPLPDAPDTVTLHYPASIRVPRRAKTTLARHQAKARPLRHQVQTVSSRQSNHSNFSSHGSIVRVNPEHRLAHVHFASKSMQAPVGSQIRVYRNVDGHRTLMGGLEVVESFRGSAKVSGSAECLAAFSSGDAIRWTYQTTELQSRGNLASHFYVQ